MIKKIILFSILFSLSACNIDSKLFPRQSISEAEKVWSFIEYQIPDKQGVLEDYYYFGLISEDLYKKIKRHEIKEGLIFMEKVRYWNDEDVIESYEDELYSDEVAFRIEHIVKFELVKKEPAIGFKYQDDENELYFETDEQPEL